MPFVSSCGYWKRRKENTVVAYGMYLYIYDSELSITILEQKDETWWSSKPFLFCYPVFFRLIDEVPVGYQ